jgi:ABC-type transport system substrate-binding protein
MVSSLSRSAVLAATVAMIGSGACRRLAAPIPAAHDGGVPTVGGELHLASFTEMRNLDPAGPLDGLSIQAVGLIFAGLVDYDEQGKIVGDLADHWDVEDGGRLYRFVLRPGTMMQDGNLLIADDVKRSIERALRPSSPNANASAADVIEGYEAFAAGKAAHLSGVVVESEDTLSIRLRTADALFIHVMGMHMMRPVCRTGGERYADDWQPCGAGPFRIAPQGWRPGTSLTLTRNASYFRSPLPYLDSIRWLFNVKLTAQSAYFQDGNLDALGDATGSFGDLLAADPRWADLGTTSAETNIYGESMNTEMPPFDNVEVRRAVAAAIDRTHYVALKAANMTALTQAIPAGIEGYDPLFEGQRYDYAAALEHMRRAGYPYDPATRKGGWPGTIDYVVYEGLPVLTAQVLQQELARIGLRIDLRVMSVPAFLASQQRRRGAQMTVGNQAADYPDAAALFQPIFTTDGIREEGSQNTAFYANGRVDDLLRRAQAELDPQRRKGLYREVNAILCDDAPWAFTFSFHHRGVRQPYVHGLTERAAWRTDFSRVWIDRAGGGAPPK